MAATEPSPVRAVFMGSDSFSVPVMRSLIEVGPSLRRPVALVGAVTRPDKPVGRGRKPAPSPVKVLAQAAGVSVVEPTGLREAETQHALRDLAPDIIVVASFGQILPTSVLRMPKFGCLNLHPSLLPRYRGPSPIAGPLLAGDRQTGTTLMLMSERMDAGPILSQLDTEIRARETRGELEARLADLSAGLLMRDLSDWLEGQLQPVPQDDALASYTSKISRDQARIDWSLPAIEIARRIQAYSPSPAAFTLIGDKTLRIFRALAGEGTAATGEVAGIFNGCLAIGTGEGLLLACELQLPGGRVLPADVLVHGHRELLGAAFDPV